ncbi:MAG: hypothetical protein H0T45_09225 [Pyrinomonadaceae bacterium]|nr:hypothetical protein [Pyrinomonadaceae bacterium]
MKRQHILVSLLLPALVFLCDCHALLRRADVELNVQVPATADEREPRGAVTFHLLDADPITLAMRAGDDENEVSEMVHREHPKLRSLAGLLNARRREAYSLSSDVFLLLDQSKPLWQPRVVQTVSIDRLGHASFRRLKPGTYWIMGYVREPWAEAFWLQQLSVGSGATTVALNQSNALYSKIVEARPKFE